MLLQHTEAMFFNCGLSGAKILTSVISNVKLKTLVSAQKSLKFVEMYLELNRTYLVERN